MKKPTRKTITQQTTNWTPRLPSVSLILGFRGNGKSAAGFYYSDECAKVHGIKKYLFGVKDEGLLPDDWGYVSDPMNFPSDAIILVDELSLHAYARRAMAKSNQVMDYITAMSRKKNQIIFYITHHSRKVDVNLVTDVDYLVYKKPSQLHIKMDRPAIKQFALKAYNILKVNGKDNSYVFDFVDDTEFLVSNPLPSYWSEDISNMVSIANAESLIENTKPQTLDEIVNEYDKALDELSLQIAELRVKSAFNKFSINKMTNKKIKLMLEKLKSTKTMLEKLIS